MSGPSLETSDIGITSKLWGSVDSVARDLADTLDFNPVCRKFKPIVAPKNKTYSLHTKIQDAPVDND